MAAVPSPSVIASTDGVTTTVTKPVNALPGDVIVIFVVGDAVPDLISGFTTIATVSGDDSRLMYRQLTDSDVSVATWTLTGATIFYHAEFVVTDVATSSPFDVDDTQVLGPSTTFDLSVTTTVDGCLLVGMGLSADVLTWTSPGGWVEYSDVNSTFVSSIVQASAGASGTKTFTSSSSTTAFVSLMAFKPNTTGIRLYLDSTAAAPITPSDFATEWNTSASAITKALVATPGTSAFTNTGVAEAVSTNPYDVAIYRGVYGPIGAGTVDGLFKGVIRALESNTAADFVMQVTLRLIQPGGAVRSVLYAGVTSTTLASEFPTTTAANRIIPRPTISHALTSQSATNGDYLEVTLGYRSLNSSTTSRTGTLTSGDNTSSDLIQNETGTSQLRPWIQLDNGLPTYSAGTGNPWYAYNQQVMQ